MSRPLTCPDGDGLAHDGCSGALPRPAPSAGVPLNDRIGHVFSFCQASTATLSGFKDGCARRLVYENTCSVHISPAHIIISRGLSMNDDVLSWWAWNKDRWFRSGRCWGRPPDGPVRYRQGHSTLDWANTRATIASPKQLQATDRTEQRRSALLGSPHARGDDDR